MSKKTTLQDALNAWSEYKTASDDGDTIPAAELYEFLLNPADYPEREALLHQIARDPIALNKLNTMLQSSEEPTAHLTTWDLALPKAAATAPEGPQTIISEGGKYTIEIRPHLADPNKGMITIQVAIQHRPELEGKTAIIQDSSSRVLLQAKIINGEASQTIDRLDQIDYGLLIKIDLGE